MLLLFGLALVLNVSDVSAATDDNSTSLDSQVTSQVYTPNEVNDAATRVKNFCDANRRLPNYVTIKNSQVTMPQFLYLITTDVVQTSQGSATAIPVKDVEAPSSSSGTTNGGSLTKTEYLQVAQNIKNIIDSTGKAPGNASTSIGQIKYETLIYIFSKIIDFQKTNGRLPNYVTVPNNGYIQTQRQTQNQAQTQLQTQTQTQNQAQTQLQTQTQTQMTCMLSDVNDAATRVKNFYETNNRLPTYVTIKNSQLTMSQFLYLLVTATINNQGSAATIPVKDVEAPSSSSGTTNGGSLTKTEYLQVAQNIKNIIDSTGKAPGNASTSIGQIKYETLIYIFSKIIDFQKTNGRLPNYVTVPGTISGNGGNGTTTLGKGQLNGLQGIEGLQILANYINKNLNHQYGAATTAEGVERTGLGDCWGLSAWTAKVLHDNGYTVRIVQGASVEASNHRWVQVLIDGKWINFDPSLVTKKYGSKPYYTTCASVSQIIATYYA
ncbi:MAG: pseudomurein-binding repeat-containing protein [Methanothermobacter sp.]|jgi:ribosomal protein L39E|nr:pseudomurein-binding repeat-containing protein [Methanothermobacter sp.]